MASPTKPSTPDSPLPPIRPVREPLAFGEWWDDLLWPKVLVAAGLGMRPNRLGLAFFVVLGAALLLGLGNAIDAKIAHADSFMVWMSYQWLPTDSLPWRWLVQGPLHLVKNFPISTLVIGPILLIAVVVLLGAVSRMAAVEIAHGRRVVWTEGLAFSASRWGSLAAAVLAPPVIVWAVALVGALLGFLLLHWPVLNIIGAVLYGIALALSLLAALAAGAYLVGLPLLAPALVCEGTDAIDAIQRVFAYVTGRLPRLLLYWALGAVGVVFVTLIVGQVVTWGVQIAARGTGAWAGDEGANMIWSAVPGITGGLTAIKPTGTYAVGGWIIGLWFAIPLGFVAATFLSCATSAATVVYLAMRQVCDGQDMAELWEPGAVEASMADAVAARGTLAKQADTGEDVPSGTQED